MIVSSTEMQNNFGMYLRIAAEEEVIVTRNGIQIAKFAAIRRKNIWKT